MNLTSAQQNTLRAAVLAEPTLTQAVANFDDAQVVAWFNTNQPAFIVWRSNVATREMLEVVTWTDVDGLTNGRARIFDWMLKLPVIDVGIAKVRTGLADCFGVASASYISILAVLKRSATRAESLLANGTGTDASPARLRAEGAITNADVAAILRG